MQDSMDRAKLPFSNFDIKTVMDPYISQVGYPVVTVIRDYSTGEIKLTQECLVCQNNNKTESKWWIPINFATSSSLNFSSTFATHWMNPEERELIIKGVDPSDWIIINMQSSGNYLLCIYKIIYTYVFLYSINLLYLLLLNSFVQVEKIFLSPVHRNLALLVSFCVRKVDFPALVRYNFKCAEN